MNKITIDFRGKDIKCNKSTEYDDPFNVKDVLQIFRYA